MHILDGNLLDWRWVCVRKSKKMMLVQLDPYNYWSPRLVWDWCKCGLLKQVASCCAQRIIHFRITGCQFVPSLKYLVVCSAMTSHGVSNSLARSHLMKEVHSVKFLLAYPFTVFSFSQLLIPLRSCATWEVAFVDVNCTLTRFHESGRGKIVSPRKRVPLMKELAGLL